jgi:hypothetical protein
MLFCQQLVALRATTYVPSADFRFSRNHSANGREKRELVRAIAKRLDKSRIAVNMSFSGLFGVVQGVNHTREVTGSSPVSPSVVIRAERNSCMS